MTGDLALGACDTLRTQNGREFVAHILHQLGYHTADGHQVAYSLIDELDEVCHKGVMDMLEENFLKGGTNG